MLSVFVQVLVPQKFIGWGVMLLYLVGSIALATAGFDTTYTTMQARQTFR